MADFMRMKYESRETKQSDIANQLGYSTSTLQRYRNVINKHLLYRIQQNNIKNWTKKALNTNFDSNSHRDNDLKRPRLT